MTKLPYLLPFVLPFLYAPAIKIADTKCIGYYSL